MNLVRWDPFADVDKLFNRMMGRGLRPALSPADPGGGRFAWSPGADISETAGEYRIRAELPGLTKDDVKVTLADGVLTIEGERKRVREKKHEKFHRLESCYGSFTRAFSLPGNIRPDAVRCESKDGVLTIHIPKTGQKKPRTIAVR